VTDAERDALFTEAFAEYARYMYALAYRLVPPQLSQDLVQDTLLDLWRGRAAYRGECSIKWWIGLMLRRKAALYRRTYRPPESLDAVEHTADHGPNPEEALLSAERRNILQREIATLSPQRRKAIEEFYSADSPDSEKRPNWAVKAKWRAMNALAKKREIQALRKRRPAA